MLKTGAGILDETRRAGMETDEMSGERAIDEIDAAGLCVCRWLRREECFDGFEYPICSSMGGGKCRVLAKWDFFML
jgi:hypothetical protein